MSSGQDRTRLPSPKMLIPTCRRLIEVWYIGSQLAGGSSRVAVSMIPPRWGSALVTGAEAGLAVATASGLDGGGTGRQATRSRLARVHAARLRTKQLGVRTDMLAPPYNRAPS